MMLNGWLIYDRAAAAENKSYIDWFLKEAEKQHIDLKLIYREEISIGIVDKCHEVYVSGEKTATPHFVVIRTIEPILQGHFEACGVSTFNCARTAQICNHKSWTHLEMSKINIPMVTTFFATKDNAPKHSPLPFPVVIKEATGRSGKQVHMVRNEMDWENTLAKLSTNEFLIQAANVKLGRDVRVFVIGKEIIGAVLRKNENDFRANFKLGGKAIPYSLNPQESKMIQKIVDHFDFGLVGIDFLINEQNELIFNEIEDVVGSRILSEVSKINLLEKYVTFIKKEVLERNLPSVNRVKISLT